MIRRIAALRYVCKKYNLGYNWKINHFKDVASICWRVNEETARYEWLEVSLFSKNFWDILWHEVGHLCLKRSMDYQSKHCDSLGISWRWGAMASDVLMAEEALASKFSIRMQKSKADKKWLEKCWHSYTSWILKDYTESENLDLHVTTIAKYSKVFR